MNYIRHKWAEFVCWLLDHKWKCLSKKGISSTHTCVRCDMFVSRLDLRSQHIVIPARGSVDLKVSMPLVPGEEGSAEVIEPEKAE